MTSKKLAAVVASAALVAALSACQGAAENGGTPRVGGDLVMARPDETVSLVPSVPTENASIYIIEEIYDTLVKPSQDGNTVEPSLATSWEQSDDKLSWTFHLRRDATFTNGSPVTAADVKFSIEQNQKPDAPWEFMVGLISEIETPDPHTVVFQTKQPWSPLPSVLSLYANSIVPKDYAGMTVEEFAKNPIGSGPFKLEDWDHGTSLTIAKNADYWKEGVPKLDSVTFKYVPDANTRATQLTTGQVHINDRPPYSSFSALENQPNIEVKKFPSSGVHFLGMNTSRKPFDDVNVRKAISQAIDREAINDAVYFGHAQIANNAYLSPYTWAHNEAIEAPEFDLDAARATLAESSVPNGFSTTLLIKSGDPEGSSEAQLVQSTLGQIGIEVKIKTLDPAAKVSAWYAGDYDMIFDTYTTDISDPDEIARIVGTPSGGAHTELTFFDDPRLDKLADVASAASDQAERKKAYDEMQQIIADNVPLVPLLYTSVLYSYSTKVHGFQPGVTGHYFLENVWLSE